MASGARPPAARPATVGTVEATGTGDPLRVGQTRARPAAGHVMHPDAARVLAGETDHWGLSSQARAEHGAMIALAGGLPTGWQTIAAEAEERRRRADQ